MRPLDSSRDSSQMLSEFKGYEACLLLDKKKKEEKKVVSMEDY